MKRAGPITPNRTRTGVFWLRTRHPRPLDDGGRFPYSAGSFRLCQADRGKQIGGRRRDDKTASTASSIPFALPRRPFLTLSSLGLSLNKLLSGKAWAMEDEGRKLPATVFLHPFLLHPWILGSVCTSGGGPGLQNQW